MRGEAFGHFIVICGYRARTISPSRSPIRCSTTRRTARSTTARACYRLIGAIFLGVGSDDGNLLLITPEGLEEAARAEADA